jgi:hypothetical protein
MREPSKILKQALTVTLLVAAVTPRGVAASPQLPSTSFTPAVFYAMNPAGPEEECAPQGKAPKWLGRWWEWWTGAWAHRYVREDEPDRPVAAPFYLRSPVLSGFIARTASNCDGGGAGGVKDELDHRCAELFLAPGAANSTRLHIPLPQLEARNARELAGEINDRLDRGETVVLKLREGQKYPVGPRLTREVAARECPGPTP